MKIKEQRREKLFRNISFVFNKKEELINIFDSEENPIHRKEISFLKNLISLEDDDYIIKYADVKQYIEILSPRFGNEAKMKESGKGFIISSINIH